jgi:antirestriction protein
MDYRIYVGTYNKYNNGNLSGAWINPADYDCKRDFIDACKALHKDESDPEIMFQDWEGEFFGLISESFIDKKFWKIINAPELQDDESKESFAEFVAHEQFFINFEKNPALETYFDYSAFARDLFFDDYVYLNEYVFRRY